jgi:hypothetical protein
MTTFPAYASNFEIFPKDSEVISHLSPLLSLVKRIEFTLRVGDPGVNQGQMVSDFDVALEQALLAGGATTCNFLLPPDVPQELDFVFAFGGRAVAVEIEKANREKILRDILKCHIYLYAGADCALVVLPKNYPHTHGVWNLFEFGVQRFGECQRYGFGTPDKLGRILLVGFDQFCAATGVPLSQETRSEMRKRAAAQGGLP